MNNNLMAADCNNEKIPLRPANDVMRLARMGSFHQTRLSFIRVLLRRLKAEKWQFKKPLWDIDENGVGVATYEAIGPNHTYTLVAFAHDLPAEKRSDRVIAEAWDATFTLHDGRVCADDIERLHLNVPLQEAGRVSDTEFVLSRANRSVRLFDYVVDCLAKGIQPDPGQIEAVGYLMRTTAVYGSGKFGAADRDIWANRPEFSGSFQPELLSVWLIRSFTIDMVEHMARMRAPKTATRLDPAIGRCLGVGNSTGLGMAPFLINHPALIHAWINARETALSRVRSLKKATIKEIIALHMLVLRVIIHAESWVVDNPWQNEKRIELRNDMYKLADFLKHYSTDFSPAISYPWDVIYQWGASHLSLEGQEQLVSLLLEDQGSLIDDLADHMSADERHYFTINGSMSLEVLLTLMKHVYNWAMKLDFSDKAVIARIWYVSEEKLEPRLGERFKESLEPYEQALAPGRDAMQAIRCLESWDLKQSVAEFLRTHPEHRHIVRRTQTAGKLPYAEIQDNTIADDMRPIDMLRCKLSFFGATKFDPRSDRWLRITLYQGAPFPDELAKLDPDALVYPPIYNAP